MEEEAESHTASDPSAALTASRVRRYVLQYKFTIKILKGAKYFNPIRQVNKTLNIACSVDKWFLPLKDCNSVTLQPQMSMLSVFLTLSNMRQPEAPLSAVGDTVCPLGILKIYLPWKHGSCNTQTPARVQRRRRDFGELRGWRAAPRAGGLRSEVRLLSSGTRRGARASSDSDPSRLGTPFPASPTSQPRVQSPVTGPKMPLPRNPRSGVPTSKCGWPASLAFCWLPRSPVWGARRQQSPASGVMGLCTMAAAEPHCWRPSQQPGGRTGLRAHGLATNSGPLRGWRQPDSKEGCAQRSGRGAQPEPRSLGGDRALLTPRCHPCDLCWAGRTGHPCDRCWAGRTRLHTGQHSRLEAAFPQSCAEDREGPSSCGSRGLPTRTSAHPQMPAWRLARPSPKLSEGR